MALSNDFEGEVVLAVPFFVDQAYVEALDHHCHDHLEIQLREGFPKANTLATVEWEPGK